VRVGEWDVDTGRGAILLKRATACNDCPNAGRDRGAKAQQRPGAQCER